MRVPLAMDSTLLADLIEYRKDRDRGVVAASRSLLQLYRERMPSMLPKKHRGRGMDGDAAPAAYGQVQLANGVDGVELLAAREARLAAATASNCSSGVFSPVYPQSTHAFAAARSPSFRYDVPHTQKHACILSLFLSPSRVRTRET